MIPVWKIIREALRVREQAKAFFLLPYFLLRQRYFDAKRESLIEVFHGEQAMRSDLVVLLVYQPKGLPESVFHTLANIREQNMAAMVVLNSRVSSQDLMRLRAATALVMCRPNFGYDFGGYRDAVLYILDSNTSVGSLTFINDSVWFPVFESCDHLSQMREIDASLVGYSYSFESRKHKRAHIQSYFFMFRGSHVLKSKAFSGFWRNLKISNSRHFTIRKSELKMTQYFEMQGFSIGWLFSGMDLIGIYEKCDDNLLKAARCYLGSIGHKMAPRLDQCNNSDQLRTELISALNRGEVGRNITAFEPETLFVHAGFAVLKKSSAKIYELQRRHLSHKGITDAFERSVGAEVRDRDYFRPADEIKRRTRQHTH